MNPIPVAPLYQLLVMGGCVSKIGLKLKEEMRAPRRSRRTWIVGGRKARKGEYVRMGNIASRSTLIHKKAYPSDGHSGVSENIFRILS
jgi:hypothetical protein